MSAIVKVFEDEDVVIPREVLRNLGVKRGEAVEIRVVRQMEPVEFSPEELAHRERILDDLWGSWSDEDAEAFEKNRQEMWQSWQARSSS